MLIVQPVPGDLQAVLAVSLRRSPDISQCSSMRTVASDQMMNTSMPMISSPHAG